MKKLLVVLVIVGSLSAVAKKPKKAEVEKACGDDIAKLCEGLERRELMECLVSKKDEVSTSCQSIVNNLRPPRR